jgi:hypothetical protein
VFKTNAITIERVRTKWNSGVKYFSTIEIKADGRITLTSTNGVEINNSEPVENISDFSDLLDAAATGFASFFAVRPGSTYNFEFSFPKDFEDSSKESFINSFRIYLSLPVNESIYEDNPEDEDWFAHTFDEAKELKLKAHAALDRILYLDGMQYLLLPTLEGLLCVSQGEYMNFESSAILRIEGQYSGFIFSMLNTWSSLSCVVFEEERTYFKLTSTLTLGIAEALLWRVQYIDQTEYFNECDFVIPLETIRESLEFGVYQLDIKIGSTRLFMSLPENQIALMLFCLQFSLQDRFALSDSVGQVLLSTPWEKEVTKKYKRIGGSGSHSWEVWELDSESGRMELKGVNYFEDCIELAVEEFGDDTFKCGTKIADPSLRQLVDSKMLFQNELFEQIDLETFVPEYVLTLKK